MKRLPFIERLTLDRFRSIRNDVVDLCNLTILVGRNGSGKSNLIDAVAFVSECMSRPLESVLADRGGIRAVSYRTPVRPFVETLGIRLDFRLVDGDERCGH